MNPTTLELQGDREIVIARTFNGPPQIVFDVWTKPELVSRWWAPQSRGVSIVSCDADVRAGGAYRYVLKVRSSGDIAFSGRYVEVKPHTRLVYTQFFEPTASGASPGDVPLTITVTFEEQNGKTRLVSRSVCPSREVRDMILATGMEDGMRETFEQCEELIAALVPQENSTR